MPSLSVMLKPSSSMCNLNCKYCFYNDLSQKRESKNYGIMSLDTAEVVVKKAFDFCKGASVNFAFQGGEPTLCGIDFYKNFVEMEKKYNIYNLKVTYGFQTNGVLLNQEWISFFKKNNFLVGLSLDGDEEMNSLRVDRNGKNSFTSALNALELLDYNNIDYNVLTVVTKHNYKNLNRTYCFLKSQGVKFMQFIPCLKGYKEKESDFALDPYEYGNFLIDLFGLYRYDYYRAKYISVRNLDNYVRLARGENAEMCSMKGHCSVQFVIEGDGTVFPCDFYCLDEYAMGNINKNDFFFLAKMPVAINFIKESLQIEKKCKDCNYFKLCMGGCKRYNLDNDYCISYKMFFDKCLPYLTLK